VILNGRTNRVTKMTPLCSLSVIPVKTGIQVSDD
jgi:hypothetical protein